MNCPYLKTRVSALVCELRSKKAQLPSKKVQLPSKKVQLPSKKAQLPSKKAQLPSSEVVMNTKLTLIALGVRWVFSKVI